VIWLSLFEPVNPRDDTTAREMYISEFCARDAHNIGAPMVRPDTPPSHQAPVSPDV